MTNPPKADEAFKQFYDYECCIPEVLDILKQEKRVALRKMAEQIWNASRDSILAKLPSDLEVLDKRIELSKKYGEVSEGATLDLYLWIHDKLTDTPHDIARDEENKNGKC